MTPEEKIKIKDKALRCSVILLFHTHPEDVLNVFTLDELEEFAKETEDYSDRTIEDILKESLSV